MGLGLIVVWIVLPVVSYLIGSLPCGLWIGRRFAGVDIRKEGSRNIGATNLTRVLLKRPGVKRSRALLLGVGSFVLDMLKGLVPALALAWFAHWRHGATQQIVYAIAYGLCAILGHTFSIYLRFRGGKAVATSAGVFFALTPLATLIALIVWALVFAILRYVSLASITAAIVLPVSTLVLSVRAGELGRRWPVIVFAAAVAALVIVRHRSNIRRLRAGEENRFGSDGK